MTLIEILVASSIFMILMSLIVGAFISFTNTKALSIRLKNSQEKVRMALDMITRLSRQADDIEIIEGTTEKRLVLYIDPLIGNPTTKTGAQFVIDSSGKLWYLECSSTIECASFSSVQASSGQSLLGDMALTFSSVVNTGSYLHRSYYNGSIPYLDVNLESTSGTSGKSFYSDAMNIRTTVLLKETL